MWNPWNKLWKITNEFIIYRKLLKIIKIIKETKLSLVQILKVYVGKLVWGKRGFLIESWWVSYPEGDQCRQYSTRCSDCECRGNALKSGHSRVGWKKMFVASLSSRVLYGEWERKRERKKTQGNIIKIITRIKKKLFLKKFINFFIKIFLCCWENIIRF